MVIQWRDRIGADPTRLHGQPTIREMRISVHDVFGYLAAGMSIEELMEEFPGLTREDVLACYAWAAEHAAATGAQ